MDNEQKILVTVGILAGVLFSLVILIGLFGLLQGLAIFAVGLVATGFIAGNLGLMPKIGP